MALAYQFIGMDHFAETRRRAGRWPSAIAPHTAIFRATLTKAGADLYGMGRQRHQRPGELPTRKIIVSCRQRYTEVVERRGVATMRGYRLSEDDHLRRALISRLLCHAVIRKDEIAQEFGVNFDEYFAPELARLAPFVEDRLVEFAPGEIRVTLLGRIFIRNVALLFDPYLEKQRLAEKPLFSKTL